MDLEVGFMEFNRGSIEVQLLSTLPNNIRFGAFEVDLPGEPRRGGSYENLNRRFRPDGTVVHFHRGLNAAVTRLRQTLSDPAETPPCVETVARRGYRFIAPVEALGEPPAPSETSLPATPRL